jgi:hypothetical protein
LVDLIDHIDEGIAECTGGHAHGLCRLLKDDKGEFYPARNEDNLKVTPEDKYDLMWYHRLLDSQPEASEQFSFGRSIAYQVAQRVRMVVVSDIKDGETVIDQIIHSLPDQIVNVDYKSVLVGNSVSLIRDRAAVWEAEWGNSYKDKYQLRYNIYAVEYSIEYIKCEACV